MRERLGLQLEIHESGWDTADLNNIASPAQDIRVDLRPHAHGHRGAVGAHRGPGPQCPGRHRRLHRVPAHGQGRRQGLGRGPPGVDRDRTGHQVRRRGRLLREARRRRQDRGRPAAGGPAGKARRRRCRRPGGVRRLAELPRGGTAARGPGQGRRGPGALRPGLPGLPRRHRGPRGNVRLGRRRNSTGSSPNRNRWPGKSGPAPPSRRPRRSSTAIPPASSRAPTPSRPGCRSSPTRPWPTSPASTSRFPDVMKTLECRIAPTDEGGIYYTGPSDDFSRPGRMWWSVPAGRGHVHHLGRNHHGVPRGRARPPPPGRHRHLPARTAEQAGAATSAGPPGTAKAGHCTPRS